MPRLSVQQLFSERREKLELTWIAGQKGGARPFPKDALNRPGPFAKLKSLKYGDLVKVHAFGQVYTFMVTENSLVAPNDSAAVFKHADKPVLSLLTCEEYIEASQTYASRRLVRAVLVSVVKAP